MLALLVPLIASLAPQVVSYLFGSKAGDVATDVAAVVQSVVPGANPSTAEGVAAINAAIKSDPAKSAELAEKLAGIAAQREAEANRERDAERQAFADELKAHLEDTANARQQTVALAAARSPLAYGPVVISMIVLAAFAATVALAMTHDFPPANQSILNLVLGTLAGMATSVVAFWVGTSASAGRQTEQVTALTQSAAASVPADLAHALVRQAGAAGAAAATRGR